MKTADYGQGRLRENLKKSYLVSVPVLSASNNLIASTKHKMAKRDSLVKQTIHVAECFLIIERNGRLTMESLRSLAKQYEVNLKDEEIAMMVKEADTNGDGAVDKDEFVNIMMRTNLFLWHTRLKQVFCKPSRTVDSSTGSKTQVLVSSGSSIFAPFSNILTSMHPLKDARCTGHPSN